MKNIKSFKQLNESNEVSDPLKQLYNGIMNDNSIQRNTMGWKDVIKALDKLYKKKIAETDDQFDDAVLRKAIAAAEDPKLKKTLETFSKELGINLDSMRDKKRY